MVGSQCISVAELVLSYLNVKKFPNFQDGNGSIENEELRGFLKDLLELVKKVVQNTKKIILYDSINRNVFESLMYLSCIYFQDYDTKDLKDFEEIIMKGCDFNKDGKISKKELTMILLALSKQE